MTIEQKIAVLEKLVTQLDDKEQLLQEGMTASEKRMIDRIVELQNEIKKLRKNRKGIGRRIS